MDSLQPHASIVLVDDDPLIRRVMSRTLVRNGYMVHEAPDGASGLKLIDEVRPDLVLLDINMPELDGIAVLSELRQRNELSDIPVIMLTAQDDRATVVECLRGGANDFVPKPFRNEELMARVVAQIQARDSIRLRALLEFAGAACHEMNQPLQVLLGHCELISQFIESPVPPPRSELVASMKEITKSGHRLADIVGRIRHLEEYRTSEYVAGSTMVDLSNPSESAGGDEESA